MNHAFVLLFLLVCTSCMLATKNSKNISTESKLAWPKAFDYINYKDTFDLEIISFRKNNTYCFTEGIPYALIIGHPTNTKALADTISVLAGCDNNTYLIGEKLRILPVENPEIPSLKKITFIKDTIIKGEKYNWQIGSEYQATWGQVLKRNL